jgi:STAM-binding protein
LKKYVKELFAQEAKEDKKKQEQINKLTGATPLQPPTPSSIINDLESIKQKYNEENEARLNEIQLKLIGENEKVDGEDLTLAHSQPQPSAPTAPSVPDRSLKPTTLQMSNVNLSKTKPVNKYNLRITNLPFNLFKQFRDAAQYNTDHNIETCGILAGKLKQNKFVISHCILPKQTGSSDTCNTESEHEIFDIIDKLDLITLGWIHTHPVSWFIYFLINSLC